MRKKYNFKSFHDFSESNYQETIDKFNRRIDRFRQIIKNNKIIFVREQATEIKQELIDRFNTIMKNIDFELVIISPIKMDLTDPDW